MQLRLILVPLIALLPCSCKSGRSTPEPIESEPVAISAPADPSLDSEAAAEGDDAAAPMPEGDEAGAAMPADSDAAAATPEAGDAGEAAAPADEPAEPPAPAEPAARAPQAPSQPAPQVDPASQAERMSRLRQQQGFLAGEYIRRGDEALDRADLQGALEAYASALELDRESEEARERLHRVQGLMGGEYEQAATGIRQSADHEIVRRAQARLAAEDANIRGDNALRANDVGAAIEQYRLAQSILRYNPLIATDSLDERIVTGKLERAIAMQDEALRESERRAQLAATEARERREREEREYRENRIRSLYAEANTAFLNDQFSRAESLTTQILADDPNNTDAAQLRQIARDARHAKAERENRQNYREQWIRTFEELDTMNVPQTDTLVFDDLARWRDVSQRLPLEFSRLDPAEQQDKQFILERLDTVRLAPRFGTPEGEGSPLSDIAAFLQNLTGVNFLVSPRVTSELDEEQRSIKLDLPERSVRKVLDLIAENSDSLRWKIEDGVVKFVTANELRGGQVLRTYEVRDLIHVPPDFPAKELNVSPSGGVEIAEEEPIEREAGVVKSDTLQQLIRDTVERDSWDADPKNSIQITPAGQMVVSQTPEVHDQIAALLEDLREATGIMVDIQARFLRVEDNFLEDIGVDFRGLGQPGLGTNAFFNDFGDPSTQSELGNEIGQGSDLGAFYDKGFTGDMRARVEQLYDASLGDEEVMTGSGGLSFQWTYLNDLQLQLVLRAVSKSERVQLVTSPRITLFNSARGNLSVLNHVAYVQDFNVEIAQAASIADPIVNVVQDGVVLDVRPVVSADRRFITLELRPTIAELRRPIREVVTTLGSQTSVTIQLPEVKYQKVRTSIPLPDGGTVLLGGLKVSDRRDQRSGVPILNKIPLVSFLFERKGSYVSNRKLLILLRASIVIPQELEPTPAQVNFGSPEPEPVPVTPSPN